MALIDQQGCKVDLSLMVYDADTWTEEGRAAAAAWLFKIARHIMKNAQDFDSEERFRRVTKPGLPLPPPALRPNSRRQSDNDD